MNCTKGEAKRLFVPHDLGERSWGDLDFFGWRDPRAPGRAYLATELDGRLVALALPLRRFLADTAQHVLDVHHDPHRRRLADGRREGGQSRAARQLGGCLHMQRPRLPAVRAGEKDAGVGGRLHESLTLEEKIQRTTTNLAAFIAKVTE